MVTVDGNRVVFQFFRPDAEKVWLIGEFNNWREGELPMSRDERGYWRAALYLPPGYHRFRYLADDQPYSDYASFGVAPGPFGFDSVVHIARGGTRRTNTLRWRTGTGPVHRDPAVPVAAVPPLHRAAGVS